MGWNRRRALGFLWASALGLSVGCGGAHEPLLVFCAAGIKDPVESAARKYEAETGVPVRLQYGPSQALVIQAETSKKGDLFLPGDNSYIELARSKNLIGETFPLAQMKAVLAVKKGNPKSIHSIRDLLRPEVKLGQVNPEAAAAGKIVRSELEKSGQWNEVVKRTLVFTGTVNEVVTGIRLGSMDAGFVWDVLVTAASELEIVAVPELASSRALVAVGVLKSSTQTEASTAFARYLASSDKGVAIFASFGYVPVAQK